MTTFGRTPFGLGFDEDEEDPSLRAITALAQTARAEQQPQTFDQDFTQDPGLAAEQAFHNRVLAERERPHDSGRDMTYDFVDPNNELTPEQFEARANSPERAEHVLDQRLELERAPETFGGSGPANAMMDAQRAKARIFEGDPDEEEPAPAPPPITAREPSPEPQALKMDMPDPVRGLVSAARGGSYGGGESPAAPQPGAEEDGAPGVNWMAVAADVITNGGRGLKDVLTVNAQQNQQWKAEQRQKQLDAQQEAYKQAQIRRLDAQAGADRSDKDWQHWKDTDLSERGYEDQRIREIEANRKDRGTAVVEEKWRAQQDPESAKNTTDVTQAERKAGAAVQGRENQKHAMIAQTAGDARALTQARTDASLDERRAHAGERIDEAARTAEARLPAQTKLRQVVSASEERQREKESLARSAIPGIAIDNDDAWSAMNNDPAARAKTMQYVKGTTTAIAALDKMIELREEIGRNPRAFQNDEAKRTAMDMMSNLQKQAIGGATITGQSGVLNGSEFPRYAADIPDGSFAATDATDIAINGLTGGSRDTVLEKLKGARAAFEQATNAGLSVGGGRLETNADRRRRALTPKAPAVAPVGISSSPDDEDDPFSGNVVGGWR